MTRRARQQTVPDWPTSLALPPAATSVAAADVAAREDNERHQQRLRTLVDGLTVTAAHAGAPGDVLTNGPQPASLTAFFFGLTKDGRHLAAEMQVKGTQVVGLVPLCASRHAEQAARAWESLAFYRLAHGREYTATEKAANERDGGKVRLEDVAEGQAVSLTQRSGKTVALAMEVEGAKVTEPKVLGTGSRLYAWQEAHAHAQRWFLPKRRKG